MANLNTFGAAAPLRVGGRRGQAFLPGAMRGITSERQLGSYSDLDLARRGLADAIAAYLRQR